MVKISLDAFAKKRKRLQRHADELAAAKKAKIDEEEEGEVAAPDGEGPMSVDNGAGPSTSG